MLAQTNTMFNSLGFHNLSVLKTCTTSIRGRTLRGLLTAGIPVLRNDAIGCVRTPPTPSHLRGPTAATSDAITTVRTRHQPCFPPQINLPGVAYKTSGLVCLFITLFAGESTVTASNTFSKH